LRDYLYIPLGGNRHGRFRRYANLLITMLLGGLWHGANWTFLIWGGLHGVYLVVNHAWRAVARKFNFAAPGPLQPFAHALSVFITFVAVVFAWTVFRAESFAAAGRMIKGLAGFGGQSHLLTFGPLAGGALAFLFTLSWLTPNSMEITWRLKPALETRYRDAGLRQTRWQWQPTTTYAVAFGLLFVVSVMALSNLSPFIYFQF
jgi:hypothetical protein